MIKQYIFKIIAKYFQRFRIKTYANLSNNKDKITGNPLIKQPVLFLGEGSVSFNEKVQLGYFPSPFFYSGNIHLEARLNESTIEFGTNVFINNNFTAIAVNKIKIGDNILIGTNVEIVDSDFHNVNPEKRFDGKAESKEVTIQNNVWLGNNVKILKGVTIGENSVIANGSIVSTNIPNNVVAGGIPAKVIKKI